MTNELSLYVDDERQAPIGWLVARDAHAAMLLLELNAIETLSLDHDLGDGPSGYDIATWLESRQAEGKHIPATLLCHSANPVGRARIELCFRSIEARRPAKS